MLTHKQILFRRNFLISVIIGETMIISAFLFLPKLTLVNEKISSGKNLIHYQDTLKTSHPEQKENQKLRKSRIRNLVKGYELPEDITKKLKISDPRVNEKSKSDHKNSDQDLKITDQNNNTNPEPPAPKENIAATTGQNAAPVRSMPRLIFEVVPSDGENKFNGKLGLSLKINEDGKVVDHKILFNSLDCSDCLNSIIQAAYKSKWEPAIVDGKKSDFWVEKSYTFN